MDISRRICLRSLIALVVAFSSWGGVAKATPVTSEILSAVVQVRARVPAAARTARFLGTDREGSGVVIDPEGLVVTIGYLILEAEMVEVIGPGSNAVRATIVGYDYDTGFGLLRATKPLGVTPMQLGQSSDLGERDQVLVASYGTPDSVRPTFVTSRREFAGYWEYLLEDAIFTAPPHPQFAGAALIGSDGRLLGVGSLFVNDALRGERVFPGNMFVPIDRLKPILADLVTQGQTSVPPRPWLGVFTEEFRGRLFVTATAPDGPAEQAGLQPGDVILGVGGEAVTRQAEFYRKVWAQGEAGVEILLEVLQGTQIHTLSVRSIDRNQYFHLDPADRKQAGTKSLRLTS